LKQEFIPSTKTAIYVESNGAGKQYLCKPCQKPEVYKGLQEDVFSQEVRLLASS